MKISKSSNMTRMRGACRAVVAAFRDVVAALDLQFQGLASDSLDAGWAADQRASALATAESELAGDLAGLAAQYGELRRTIETDIAATLTPPTPTDPVAAISAAFDRQAIWARVRAYLDTHESRNLVTEIRNLAVEAAATADLGWFTAVTPEIPMYMRSRDQWIVTDLALAEIDEARRPILSDDQRDAAAVLDELRTGYARFDEARTLADRALHHRAWGLYDVIPDWNPGATLRLLDTPPKWVPEMGNTSIGISARNDDF